jgi:cysteine synthase A
LPFLLKHEGVFVGPSAALNVVGAVKLARALPEGARVATILCDAGDR